MIILWMLLGAAAGTAASIVWTRRKPRVDFGEIAREYQRRFEDNQEVFEKLKKRLV